MTLRERILQFIEYKRITKNKFYTITGLSNGFLDKNINIGSDKIEIIYSHFPEINLYWLILGQEPMILPNAIPESTGKLNEPGIVYEVPTESELIKTKNDIIAILKQQNEDLRADKQIFVNLLNSKLFNNNL